MRSRRSQCQPFPVSALFRGGTGSFTVTSQGGCAWTASSGAGWITITSGASGSGNGTVAFTVSANTATTSRTGTITAGGQTFTVTQAAAPCTYVLSPVSLSVVAGGGTGSFTVTSQGGCAWTASSGVGWITITSGASGSGNGTVAFTVAANSTSAERRGVV